MSNSETGAFRDRPREGVLIKDRYRIQRELGRGGIGVVYLAHDLQLHNRPVVIKVLRDTAGPAWLIKKFRQEIEALVRIEHPGVVGIIDAGEMPDGQLFVVMQFVEGVTLRSILMETGGPLSFELTARIIDQVGRALTAAHDRGVLHCDLKPENIMIQTSQPGEEIVKLIDFGIAKIRDSSVSSVEPTRIAGTMGYMAPEQLSGAPTTASDIFSLGIIAYEMITGRKPFPEDNIVMLIESHKSGVKYTPTTLRPDLPEPAQSVILRALNPDPSQRHAQARDFSNELRAALSTPDRFPSTPAFNRQPPPAGSVPRKRSFSTVLIVNVLLVLATVAVVALVSRYVMHPTETRPLPPAISPKPELHLKYHMMMQKTENSKPFRIAKELLFEQGNRVQLFVTPEQAGYLYLVNEGPGGYVVLFPSTLNNNGSPSVAANQEIQIPGRGSFVFDAEEGTEKLWIVYSPQEVPELNGLKSAATPEKKGELNDPELIQSWTRFIKSHPPDRTQFSRDVDGIQTVLTAKSDALVYLMQLEHH